MAASGGNLDSDKRTEMYNTILEDAIMPFSGRVRDGGELGAEDMLGLGTAALGDKQRPVMNHSSFCLSASDGRVLAYRGNDGERPGERPRDRKG